MFISVTRNVGIRAYGGEDKMRPMDKVAVSGMAGSSAGAVAGLARAYFIFCSSFLFSLLLFSSNCQYLVLTFSSIYKYPGGPTRLLPAIVIWGLIGSGGQAIANRWSSGPGAAQAKDDGTSWLWKMSPLKKLTDEEYMDLMKEKILKVEVDIALIDDRIAELRATEKAKGPTETGKDGSSSI